MKKVMIKIISAIMVLTLISGICAAGISAAEEQQFYEEGIYQYTVSGGEAKIKDVFGLAGDATLPRELGGYPVTAVGEGAVRSENQLISIVIPSCIEIIEKNAFVGCDNLKSVVFEDNSNVKSIDTGVFERCRSLETVDFGENSVLETICVSAFWNCTSLENIVLPDSLKTIEDKAFENCSSLKSIVIPENVSSIYEGPFASCHSLEKIYVDENNPYFTNDEWGILYNKDKTTIVTYPAGSRRTSYVIPGYVTYVARSAFMGNEYLEEISWVNPETIIGISAFSFCTSLYRANIPEGTKRIEDWIFNACYSLKDVVLPESLEVIDAGAFHWCTSLETINIPPEVYWIAPNSFKECTALRDVVLPEGLLEIGGSAFEKCFGLESINIPETVELVKHSAFYQCFSLKEVTLPEELPETYYPADFPGIFTNEFRYCFNLESITLPKDAEIIQDGAFEDCRKLKTVTIPQNVHIMTGSAFKNSSAFESISVDEKNTSFSASSDGILFNKDKTKLVYYPANKPATVYAVPASVKVIGEYAFSNIQNLASIVIPASVEEIESYAFHSFNLRDIYFEGTEEEWNAFEASTNTAVKNATVHFNHKNGDHVHDYSQEITVEPTCKANGKKVYTCSCGVSAEKEFHFSMASKFCRNNEFEWRNPVDSDCTKMGSVEYCCNKCGNCFWTSAVAKEMHSMDITVFNDNTINFECIDCGYFYQEIIPQNAGYAWYVTETEDSLYISEYGDMIMFPKDPVKKDKVFVGWQNESGEMIEKNQAMPEKNLKLTPVFVNEYYKVTYTVRGETFETMQKYGEEINLDINLPEGYELEKWTDENGNDFEMPEAMPAKELALVAKIKGVRSNPGLDVYVDFDDGCFGDKTDRVIMKAGKTETPADKGAVYVTNGVNHHQVASYQITMVTIENGEEKTAQPVNGNLVRIRIPIPEGFSEEDTFEIIHRYAESGREPITPVAKDGYLEFYTGHFSTFEVYVASKLSISKMPDSTNVIYKGSLDLGGIELTYLDNNGEAVKVTDTYQMNVYGLDSSKTGKQTVTIEYNCESVELEVNVNYSWWQWIIRIFLLGFIWY